MNNETYERVELTITPFDAEDVITTSGGTGIPDLNTDPNEMLI